jgi:hypothetical protein
MKPWTRALALACVFEIPLLGLLMRETPSATSTSLLTLYHAIPLGVVSYVFLKAFGHSAPPGGVLPWDILFWGCIFIIQMMLTVPFVFMLLSLIKIARRRVQQGQQEQ